MTKKSEEFKKKFKECEEYTIDDLDLTTAKVVRPRAKLRKTYPLSLRINKADIVEAKLISKEKGLPYQTLLKSYIKIGLKKDRKILVGV